MDLLGATPQRGCDAARLVVRARRRAGAHAGFGADRQRPADFRGRQGCRRASRRSRASDAIGADAKPATTTNCVKRFPAALCSTFWRSRCRLRSSASSGPRPCIGPAARRTAFHPADPLDRGAAGRSGDSVRDRWREERQRHARASQAGRGSIPVTIENYESELRKNFVILSAARAAHKIEQRARRWAPSSMPICSRR